MDIAVSTYIIVQDIPSGVSFILRAPVSASLSYKVLHLTLYSKGQSQRNLLMGEDVGFTLHGGNEVEEILGNRNKFSYPKPKSLVSKLIEMSTNKNAIILDFFAGPGTTGHTVLEFNKEDGGNRQFILCTNNENNICEEVTYERLKRVINGYTTRKGKGVEGLGGNLKYYKTDIVYKLMISMT